MPLRGAALASVGMNAPEFAQCANIVLSLKPIAIESSDKGTHFCIRTVEGRYGQFRIDDLFPTNPQRPNVLTLMITFEVWNSPRIALVDDGATHSIHRRGSSEIVQTFSIDLDAGSASTPGGIWSNDWDLWFEAVNDNVRYLVPLNGATAALIGKTSAGYSGCASAYFSRARILVSDSIKGAWICIKTNQGRYSEIEIRDIVTRPVESRASVVHSFWTLVISYQTWEL